MKLVQTVAVPPSEAWYGGSCLGRAFASDWFPRRSQNAKERGHKGLDSQNLTSYYLSPRQPKIQAYFSIQTGQEVAASYVGEISDQRFWHGEHCTFRRNSEWCEK